MIQIDNRTDIPYEVIGKEIDMLRKDDGTLHTYFEGMKERRVLRYKDKSYNLITITHLDSTEYVVSKMGDEV